MSDLRGELEQALAVMRSEGDGPGDKLFDGITQALRDDSKRDMEKAATIWREYVSCCCWLHSRSPLKEHHHGEETQADRGATPAGHRGRG